MKWKKKKKENVEEFIGYFSFLLFKIFQMY